MTDEQFNHAQDKKEQIERYEQLSSRLQKNYANVKRDEINQFEILDLLSSLGNALRVLIKIKKEEFLEKIKSKNSDDKFRILKRTETYKPENWQ